MKNNQQTNTPKIYKSIALTISSADFENDYRKVLSTELAHVKIRGLQLLLLQNAVFTAKVSPGARRHFGSA